MHHCFIYFYPLLVENALFYMYISEIPFINILINIENNNNNSSRLEFYCIPATPKNTVQDKLQPMRYNKINNNTIEAGGTNVVVVIVVVSWFGC